jgi:hypothetical protein
MLFLLFAGTAAAGELLISEIAPAATGGDWVEIFFRGACGERHDISRYYVTMYYGTNEPLSGDPVSLAGCDRPETPWDDRYAVVHPAAPEVPDETDLTGDTNGNGILDLYCGNYPGSFWNSDCVVAIDTDDEPAGGIIDFAAYSNRDGSANDTILGYLAHAQTLGQWEKYSGDNPQLCMIDIGIAGLQGHQSIARRDGPDTGRKEDFAVTSFQTPGRPNIFSAGPGGGGSLFTLARDRITVLPGHPLLGECRLALTVREVCSLRFRVFTPTGIMVHESPLRRDMPPGPADLAWDLRGRGRSAGTGLYLLLVEATSRALRRSQRETAYLIVSRYR